VAGGRRSALPALITSARVGKSLDADQRNRRYLASMAVRVACFLAGCFAPAPYNIALFIGAAIIPGVAVILANAIDIRTPPPEPTAQAAPTASAISSAIVVDGEVEQPPEGAR
jgi:Protein of unknown function (DUF3099)